MIKTPIAVLGIDLGKNTCSLAGLDASGAVVLRRVGRRKFSASRTFHSTGAWNGACVSSSGQGERPVMSTAGLSISACLGEISSRLTEAAAVAKAAVTCAQSGSEREALRIAMDLDELLNETQTLHGAVCLIGRIERREEARVQSGG